MLLVRIGAYAQCVVVKFGCAQTPHVSVSSLCAQHVVDVHLFCVHQNGDYQPTMQIMEVHSFKNQKLIVVSDLALDLHHRGLVETSIFLYRSRYHSQYYSIERSSLQSRTWVGKCYFAASRSHGTTCQHHRGRGNKGASLGGIPRLLV
jgi:hypothetical protein